MCIRDRNKRFVVGIDRAKMRLYDCEQDEGGELVDSGQEKPEEPKIDKKKYAKINF